MNGITELTALLRKDTTNQSIVVLSTVLYLCLYLIAIRDVRLTNGAVGFQSAPVHRALEMSSFLGFRPIVEVVVPPIVVFISPLNIAIGLTISALVGLNVLLVYTVYAQPRKCDISDTMGVIASIPALVSGTACCGPIIPIILGIQVTGTFVALTKVAIPVAILLLVLTIIALLRKISV